MLKRNILFAYLLVAASSLVFSQSVLTVEDAIKIGLKKNYAVLIIKNEQLFMNLLWIK